MINSLTASVFYKACEQLKFGQLTVIAPDKSRHVFGQGEPAAELRISDWAAIRALFRRGSVGLGEAYIEGLWDSPNVEQFVHMALLNERVTDHFAAGTWLQRLKLVIKDRILRQNSVKGSSKNIQAHYDVGNAFYSLWLDPSMTYSSALYSSDNCTLFDAQLNKYGQLLGRIGDTDEKTLEVGCGWGGFAEHASAHGRNVTGITISPSQQHYAKNRVGNRADIQLCDYRKIQGKFDAIVSIEMIEAVGSKYWPGYFKMLKNRLNEHGRIALQAIIVEDKHAEYYRTHSDFIRHYTFPGGMLISPEQIRTQAAAVGLSVNNMKRFGLDYARTLREWLRRFDAAEPEIRAMGHTDEFIRSWRFYLQICAAAFQVERKINVVHLDMHHA